MRRQMPPAKLNKNTFCSFCGTRFPEGAPWPRNCAACQNTSYVNPVPVAVLVVPIGDGVLTVRRGIEPHIGKLALPGGYINLGESWQRAATREVEEETGLVVDTAGVRDFRVLSAPDGTVLVFGTAGALPANALDVAAFEPSHETSELVIVRAAQELAFPLHTQVLAAWFARKPS